MPDHKLLGRTLLRLAHNYTFDDAAEAYCSRDIEDQIDVQDLLKSSNSYEWEKVQLPELGMYLLGRFSHETQTPLFCRVRRSLSL